MERILKACVVLLPLLCGCFDYQAASRCYGSDASCGSVAGDDLCGGQASRCAGSSAALCDGFEDTALSSDWYPYPGPAGASVTHDTSRACRGEASLHFHLDAASAGDSPRIIIEETKTDTPAPLTDHWVRAFAFMPSTSSTAALDRLIILGQVGAPYRDIELGAADGKVAMNNELATTPYTHSARAFPTDQWVCIVLAVTQGSPGAIDVSLDDNAVADLQLQTDTSPSPPLAAVRFGVDFDQLPTSQDPIDVWLDEVVISGSPLDCRR